jgi:hypothetical protein
MDESSSGIHAYNRTSEALEDDLSSLVGDASPLDSSEALQAQRAQNCRSKLQKVCSLSFLAIYALVYVSLSSNPEIVLVNSGYQYDQNFAAIPVGASKRDAGNYTRVNGFSSTTTSTSTSTSTSTPTGTEAQQMQKMRSRHIEQTASRIARSFTPVSPNSWCIDGRLKFEQAKRRPMGLCYLKIPRAASSTLVGINVRIARNFATRQGLAETCIRHDGPSPGFNYRQREASLSYLWTFVRDPADRSMSRVASNVAKKDMRLPPTNLRLNEMDETSGYVLEALKTSNDIQFGTISEGRGGFQMQYSMLRIVDEYIFWNASNPTNVHHAQRMQQNVKELLKAYDFIGVVERFDESLVALQLLLGLETSDILYFSSRLRNGYTGIKVKGRDEYVCQKNIDPYTLRTPTVEDYLSGGRWWAENYGDLLLHRAASLSLDQTIENIGVDEYSNALKNFRSMLQKAQETCRPTFPCSNNGTDQSDQSEDDCYFGDGIGIGCGFPCLDSLVKRDPVPA